MAINAIISTSKSSSCDRLLSITGDAETLRLLPVSDILNAEIIHREGECIWLKKISWKKQISWLEEEQVERFTSDFRIVADYFVQVRKHKEYHPSEKAMEHVNEVLKLMSVLTDDSRFEDVLNELGERRNKKHVRGSRQG